MNIQSLLASDDSCQQQCYTKGHQDKADFLESCRREVDHAVINDDDHV